MANRGRPKHDDVLTPAEWRVLGAVKHGLSNPAIAKRMGISTDAVKFHVSNILTKLCLDSRKDLRIWVSGQKGSKLLDARTDQAALHGVMQIARTVNDLAESKDWYANRLGLEHLYTFGNMCFMGCGDLRLMLVESEKMQPESIIYFKVSALKAFCERLTQEGVTLVGAPHLIHKHADGTEEWLAFIEDLEKRLIGLISTD